jgi:cell wall-associated NlpC family hydrolase
LLLRAKALVALGLMTVGLAFAFSGVSAADSGGAAAAAAPSDAPAPTPAPPPAPAPAPPPPGAAGYSIPPLHPTVAGSVGVIRHGIAYAPALAPIQVQRAIWAADTLVGKPYIFGGGHQSFRARGYDCSGTVSFALHGGGLLPAPLDSSDFMSWGESGKGAWITVYTNPGHAWAVIAGMRLDTSGPGPSGPRWRTQRRSGRGYTARHPQAF